MHALTSQPRDHRFDRAAIAVRHRLLDLQRLAVEADGGDGEEAGAGAVDGKGAALFEGAVDVDAVVAGGVADEGDGDVVGGAPEERGHGVRGSHAEDVAGGGLALTARGNPVLDADAVAAEAVGIVGDVAGGEDARDAAPEKLVDDDAVVDGQPAGLGKLDIRADADARHDEVGGDRFTGGENDAVALEGRDRGAEAEMDAVLLVETADERADFVALVMMPPPRGR